MGFLQSYGSLLLKHPGRIILTGVISVLVLFGIALSIRPLPNFSDPLIGFEVRGTTIANRLNTYKLLSDETTATINNLSLQANSDIFEYIKHRQPLHGSSNDNSSADDTTLGNNGNKLDEDVPLILELGSTQAAGKNDNITLANSLMDDGEEEYYKSVNSNQSTKVSLVHHSLDSPRAFCGKLNEGYSQVVIAPSAKNTNAGLFNLQSMLAICHLDHVLRLERASSFEDSALFKEDCERFKTNASSETLCCNSFSLPNYIACYNNKPSCLELTSRDLKEMELALNLCAPHYFRVPYERCFQNGSSEEADRTVTNPFGDIFSATNPVDSPHCGFIPDKCLKCNGWTYAVLHYLVSDNWLTQKGRAPSVGKSAKQRQLQKQHHKRQQSAKIASLASNRLSYTNIFLPMAKSTSLMKYYQKVSNQNLKSAYVQVRAMDLGLKNSLFELLISQDARLFIFALISILTVISIYCWSFLISLVILMIICLSLCLSYTIYELVLNIPIFPFMNLLAVVISFGICSDNAMLFCKHWTHQESSSSSSSSTKPANQATTATNGNQQQTTIRNKDQCLELERTNVDRILKRAIVSTFVATLATACSFIISAISGVIAVRCFCIYATLSVITNYLLIVALLPPALILDSRISNIANELMASKGPQIAKMIGSLHSTRKSLLDLGCFIHNVKILGFVTQFKYFLIALFVTLLVASSVLVFYEPRMSPADDDDIQLLSSRHAFERYDRNLRRQFAFERPPTQVANGYQMTHDSLNTETLPIRVVFGVLPIDTGNHLDPHDRGRLVFDSEFDITEPNAQLWMLEFCDNLRKQRFVHHLAGEHMSSCFMYAFRSWMRERSCTDPVLGDDLSPCCRDFPFPLPKPVFNKCIQVALRMFHNTPNYVSNPGVYFFKNSTQVAALVVEYKSNQPFTESYTKMDRFYSDVDEWVRLQINNTAPPGLQSGWFTSSNLDLLALQEELTQSTSYSILLEIMFAMFALLLGTRDSLLTIIGTLTIGTIIISTIAALILFRWTLGVAESILISLTIGLSIDFALHYTVAFSERRRKASIENIIHGILDEVGSPIGLATITTTLAGFVIYWSDILAYQQLGIFLILIALISWTTSTFFLLPMLATVSSILVYVQVYFQSAARTALNLIDRF